MGNKVQTVARFHKRKRLHEEQLESYLLKKPQLVNELGRYESNGKDGELETLLSCAIRGKRIKDVKFLLSKGADPNIKYLCPEYRVGAYQGSVMLWTAVHEACRITG